MLFRSRRLDELFVHDRSAIGPLHGVPVTIKDWIDVDGFPCAGTTDRSDRRPERDATVVARLRQAGAVVIAKTKPWGDVLHPIDPSRSPGGSSTGEAVAVSSGGSLGGLGSDSGGSIRLPAAWCGVLGYKPTAGLVPNTGHFPRVGAHHDGRTQIGPIGHTIDDLTLLMAVIAGPDELDAGVPPIDLLWSFQTKPVNQRFAVIVAEADQAVRAAVDRAAATLQAAGLERVEWTAPWLEESFDLTRRYWDRTRRSGAEVDRDLHDWDTFRFRYLRATRKIDYILTPVAATAAPVTTEDGVLPTHHFSYTAPASLTGSPALSIPSGNDEHLPVAVQLIGKPWHDPKLLAAARYLAR